MLITAVTPSCNSILFGATRALRSSALARAAPASLAQSNRSDVPVRTVTVTVSIAGISLTIVLNYLLPTEIFQLLPQMTALVITVNRSFIVIARLRYRQTRSRLGLWYPAPWTPWSDRPVLVVVLVVLSIPAIDSTARVPLLLAMLGLAALAFASRLYSRHISGLS